MTTSVTPSYYFKFLSFALKINWDIVLFSATIADSYDLFITNIILFFFFTLVSYVSIGNEFNKVKVKAKQFWQISV